MKNKKLTIEQVYERIKDKEETFIRHVGCFDLTEFEKQNKLPYKFTLEDACGLIEQNERWRLALFCMLCGLYKCARLLLTEESHE